MRTWSILGGAGIELNMNSNYGANLEPNRIFISELYPSF